MHAIAPVFALLIILFILLLGIKKITRLRFCVICASLSLTWLGLLALYRTHRFTDTTLLALLMGGSVVGLFYLVEHYTPERFHLFRLPFLLTLFATAYTVITLPEDLPALAAVLAALWLIFLAIYLARTVPRLRALAKTLLECCKRW